MKPIKDKSKQYVLKDVGSPLFKKIMHGKDWIGRTCHHARGGYVGVIGTTLSFRALTEVEAFEGVVPLYVPPPKQKPTGTGTVVVRRRKGKVVAQYTTHANLPTVWEVPTEPIDVVQGLPQRKRNFDCEAR